MKTHSQFLYNYMFKIHRWVLSIEYNYMKINVVGDFAEMKTKILWNKYKIIHGLCRYFTTHPNLTSPLTAHCDAHSNNWIQLFLVRESYRNCNFIISFTFCCYEVIFIKDWAQHLVFAVTCVDMCRHVEVGLALALALRAFTRPPSCTAAEGTAGQVLPRAGCWAAVRTGPQLTQRVCFTRAQGHKGQGREEPWKPPQ